ncbi:MAG TPA: hypothetical protein VHC23_01060 [Jatrophihabitans sp.]|nr:hypothetical protein [Jatrophihabitans sp.]
MRMLSSRNSGNPTSCTQPREPVTSRPPASTSAPAPQATSAPNAVAARAISTDTSTLPATTRLRRGSWVNVVSTVRCVHSVVRVRTATTGSSVASTKDGKST